MRQKSLSTHTVRVSFEEFQRRMTAGGRLDGTSSEVVTLNLIIRADVRGSIEAIQKELGKLEHPEVQVKVLQASVGGITVADVTLAHASQAVIIGFNVIPDEAARSLADERDVEIRRYDVIYKVTDDIRAESADEAFACLQQNYFDWNEVRVTTASELASVCKNLTSPNASAIRIKKALHGVFETFYQFDIDFLKKENLSKALLQFNRFKGVSDFVISYTAQNGLGGHSIPIDDAALFLMTTLGIITEAEAEKRKITGLERTIPKNKGIEFSVLVHQLAVAYFKSPFNTQVRDIILSIAPDAKDRFPKRGAAKRAAAQAAAEAKAAAEAAIAAEKAAKEAEKAKEKAAKEAAKAKEKAAIKKRKRKEQRKKLPRKIKGCGRKEEGRHEKSRQKKGYQKKTGNRKVTKSKTGTGKKKIIRRKKKTHRRTSSSSRKSTSKSLARRKPR